MVIVKHVKSGPNDDQAFFHSGDGFTGQIELGPATIHDVSSGYNVNVDSVLPRYPSYVAAKARADADCPPAETRSARNHIARAAELSPTAH